MGHPIKQPLITALAALSALALAAPFALADLPVVAAAEADNHQTVADAQASLAWKLIERAPPGADAMVRRRASPPRSRCWTKAPIRACRPPC